MTNNNIFFDLKISNPDEMLLKADLVYEIEKQIKSRKLNQDEVESILNINKSDIYDLEIGRLYKFSIDQLNNFVKLMENLTTK